MPWPGKEMKCGQSLGVTQNLPAGCTTLAFSLVGLSAPGFQVGREWGDPALGMHHPARHLMTFHLHTR